MNKNIVLLKTLLLSTSQINIFRYSKDEKKRRKIIVGFIGAVCLYAMLMAYSISMCVGYGQYGMIDAAPVMCAVIISTVAFVMTLFKTNGYLFNFKEYDMLMSLPFEPRTVAGCKFLYMYIKSLPWYMSISLAMMIGYGVYASPSAAVYPVWIILSLFLPVIPMLASAFVGFLIAKISSGFRKTNIVQTIITIIFVLFCFSFRFIIEDIFRNDKVEATLEKASEITDTAAGIYLPAKWFSDAITKGSIVGFLLMIIVSSALFAVLFCIVGKSYRRINSAMKSHGSAKRYNMSAQKQKSVVRSIAFKEFKRMTGSTAYMVNGGMGFILAILAGIITLVFGADKIIAVVTQGAPLDAQMLQPAIPLIVYFFIGMVATTAISPSLEGKNYWIIQSLPIEKKTLYQGKMLFNMYLCAPVTVFCIICFCVASKVPAGEAALYILEGLALCAFSTSWGCVCGVRHLRLDWENEIEVIKQSSAVVIYMLPNMFVDMGLVVLTVFLGTITSHIVLALIMTLITAVLASLSYMAVMRLARE